MTAPTPSRRTLTRAAAWTVPTLAVGAAVPATAASGPAISRAFTIGRTTSGCNSGQALLTVESNQTTSYFTIIRASSGTTVTDVYASVLIQKSVVDQMTSPLTWTSNTTNWPAPVREENAGVGVVYSNAGIDYYRYYSKFAGTVPAPVNGTITFPAFLWTSRCSTALAAGPVAVNGRGMATINGTVQTNVGGWRTV